MKTTKNLWPLGVTLTLILFLCGTITLVIVAVHNPADLVSASYYEDEVLYQRQLDRLDSAERLKVNARVTYDPAQQRIIVALPPGQAPTETQGRVQLYRPSAANLDQQLDFKPDANGVQSFDARGMQPGLWRVKVFWTANGTEYRFDQKVVIKTKTL